MKTMLFVFLANVTNVPAPIFGKHIFLWFGGIVILFIAKLAYQQISSIWAMDFDIGPDNLTLQEISEELNW